MIEFFSEVSVADIVLRVVVIVVAAWLGKTWARMNKVVRVDSKTFVVMRPVVTQYVLSQEAYDLLAVKEEGTGYLIAKTEKSPSVLRTKNPVRRLALVTRSWLGR